MTRDVSERTLAQRGVIVVVVLALCTWLVYLRANGAFRSDDQVTAAVGDTGGAFRVGADVKLDGAIVGRVRGIEPTEGGVDLDLAVSDGAIERIPSDVVARVLPATIFGTSYVELVSHGGANGHLRAGARIEQDRSQPTLELQHALDDIDRLTKALGPAELASALGASAQALDGRGELIGGMVTDVNDYLAKLNPRMPQVRRNLDKLADNLELVDQLAPDLLQAADDGIDFMNSVGRQEAQLTTLLTGSTSATMAGRTFLDRHERALVDFINGSGAFVDVLYDYRRSMTDAVGVNLELGKVLPRALEDNAVKTVGPLHLSFEGDELPYYGPGDRPSYGGGSFSALGERQ